MIIIDGSFGEGGGQILRSALGLSLVTGKPFKIDNIRTGRRKPGLLRQHLTAVNASVKIGNATVKGNYMNGKELFFEPHSISPGNYQFQVGTAGSATLVLQTILPALLFGKSPSGLILEGGTHNPYAPPFDFLKFCFLSCLTKMGVQIQCSLSRYGFYPAGGGRFEINIHPVQTLQSLSLMKRGELLRKEVIGIVSAIPFRIAQEEVRIVCLKMGWEKDIGKVISVNSRGPGNILFAILEYENICQVFTGFGQRGIPLQKVAENVVTQVKKYLSSDAPVGEYLADQLLIPLSLAGEGSFCTTGISEHTITNIEVIKKFLDIDIHYRKTGENNFEIIMEGDQYEMGKNQ